jgi:hypothetical protein
VEKVRRHHALRREDSEGDKSLEGFKGGSYRRLRLNNTNFLSAPPRLGGLGGRQIDGLLADCAVSLRHFALFECEREKTQRPFLTLKVCLEPLFAKLKKLIFHFVPRIFGPNSIFHFIEF